MKKTFVWFGLQVALHEAEVFGLGRWWASILRWNGLLAYLPHFAMAAVITAIVFRKELSRGRFLSWLAIQIAIYVVYRMSFSGFRPDLTSYAIYVAGACVVTWVIFGRAADGSRFKVSRPDGANAFFRCEFFSIVIDDIAATARIRGRTDHWLDAREQSGKDAKNGKGMVDHELPVLGLEQSSSANMVDKTVAQVATGMASGSAVVNGQTVFVNAPVSVTTGYTSYTEATGKYTMTFRWRSTSFKTASIQVSRTNDGQLKRSGYARQESDFGKSLALTFGKVPEKVKTAFEKDFWPQVQTRIEALKKSGEATALNAALSEAEDRFLEAEANTKAQSLERETAKRAVANAASATARAEREGLVAGRGLRGDFEDWQYEATSGKILWLVMLDHSGVALLANGSDCWSGPIVGAKVQRESIEGRPATQELVVEVRDPDYERQYLKRHRFRVLSGRSAAELTEWVDRLEILAMR